MKIPVDGIELNCETSGDGTPLVLTHGLGNDLHFWNAIEAELAAHHQVIRWDVRGFGSSDKPSGPYTAMQLAADLAGLLDVLGLERVHLAGTSMGGVITQRFALDHPDRVRTLVLVSTSSEVGERATRRWQRLAARIESQGFDASAADATRAFAPAFASRHPEIVDAFTREIYANDPLAYAAAARAMSDYRWTDELARLLCPTLILQGLDDLLTPPGGAVKMSRAFPRARLLLIPDAGHNLPVERPDLFCAATLAFLAAADFSSPEPVARVGLV